MPKVVVCIATELEGRYLPSFPDIEGCSVAIVQTGVGPVNAAMALTRFLSHHEVGLVVSIGVGGAYPGSGLEIGDVVCAESEYYADLGADSPEGFLDMKALGFAVVGEYYNRLPLDRFPTPRRARFVTRATCTGRIEDYRASPESHDCVAHVAPEFGKTRGRRAQRIDITWR